MNELSLIPQLHFWVGTISIISGFGAMLFSKGRALHKLSGKIFFYTMILLCFSGFYLSYSRQLQFTFFLSVLAFYLVLTGYYAGSRSSLKVTVIDKVGFWFILAYCVFSVFLSLAGSALNWRHPATDPPYLGYLFFSVCSAILTVFDYKLLKQGTLNVTNRWKRHLSRMCAAMLIATTIFFLGNNHVLPDALRQDYLLFTPILIVVVFILVWILLFSRFTPSE